MAKKAFKLEKKTEKAKTDISKDKKSMEKIQKTLNDDLLYEKKLASEL